MKIDIWDKTGFEKGKYYADAFFYPHAGYRGNIYNSTGKTIGDYHTWDSTEIPNYFIFKFKD